MKAVRKKSYTCVFPTLSRTQSSLSFGPWIKVFHFSEMLERKRVCVCVCVRERERMCTVDEHIWAAARSRLVSSLDVSVLALTRNLQRPLFSFLFFFFLLCFMVFLSHDNKMTSSINLLLIWPNTITVDLDMLARFSDNYTLRNIIRHTHTSTHQQKKIRH